ncbi:SGNH/GDSL hydrolase family protein [Sphingomonas sp. BK580]|uniref:SGNH/GDSL hydrolase family protein n=1 Tax=Sphingomonas sp. BK580 TaxID=2586972 RepID=UPI00161A7BC2|nr:SGNH/GDSL hydrolase family protein [Sphingomonas sp. BK580]MBB3691440.1 hypothetical protein [Sphingomonas sp. BK580]
MRNLLMRVSAFALALVAAATPVAAQTVTTVNGDESVRVIQNGSTKSAPIGSLVATLSNASGVPTPYAGAALPKWRKALNSLRAGVSGNIRIAFVGDSKTRFFPLAGAAPKSKPRRVGELLANAGVPTITDTIFGAGGAGTMAEAVSYDPKLSGFSGWGGGNISLGGAAYYSGGTTAGTFTPAKAVDRASFYFVQTPGAATFTVTKGPETFNLTSNGTAALGKADVTFTTKDNSPISIARTGGGNFNFVGLVAWDSATPAVEIANFGVAGVQSGFQADTANAWSPANALATYAPSLTVINLGTNDLNQGQTLATFLANESTIIDKAQLSGDVIVIWPAVAGTTAGGGTDATRAAWKPQLRALAASKGALFLDEEAMFGGRVGAQSGGWFSDDLHEAAPAAFAEASAMTRLILGQ